MPSAALPCDAQLSALALCERRHPREKELVCKVTRKRESVGGGDSHRFISISNLSKPLSTSTESKKGSQRRSCLVPPQAALPARGGRPRRVLRSSVQKQRQEQDTTRLADERAERVPGRGREARGVSGESGERRRRERRRGEEGMKSVSSYFYTHNGTSSPPQMNELLLVFVFLRGVESTL